MNTKLNQAILKVAQSNPEFAKLIKDELTKQAVPLGSYDEDQYAWDAAVEKLEDALSHAGRQLNRTIVGADNQITTSATVALILSRAIGNIGALRETGSQEALKAAKLLKASADALVRLATAVRKR